MNNIQIHETAYVHPTAYLEGNITIGEWSWVGPGAVIVGDVTIGAHTAIYFNSALRGTITVGNYVCIYDLVNIEGGRPFLINNDGSRSESPDATIIHDRAWINHGATMHGSQVGEGAAVCINAALDYNTRIGKGAIVTNGSSTRVNTEIPAFCIAEGVPAKIIKRDITEEDVRECLGLYPNDWTDATADWIKEQAELRNSLKG